MKVGKFLGTGKLYIVVVVRIMLPLVKLGHDQASCSICRARFSWCAFDFGLVAWLLVRQRGGFGTGRAAFPWTKVGKVSGLAGIGGVARVGLSDTMTFFT